MVVVACWASVLGVGWGSWKRAEMVGESQGGRGGGFIVCLLLALVLRVGGN